MNFLLTFGTSIFSFPFKYLEVNESDFRISAYVPCATKLPPKVPASGPISIIISAAFMMSSSCSTIITVLPNFFKLSNTSTNFSVSFGCKPILGSSKIYIEPTKELPKEVAKLIRWDSPPESDADFLFKLK